MDCSTSVKVAVRIRPLSPQESLNDATQCINTIPGMPQIIAGTDAFFTFDNVFDVDSTQAEIYDDCVVELVNAAFEGFNATILAYGQTGSGKTWTMGSASYSDMRLGSENFGIIPRVITSIFEIMEQKEIDDPNSTYKVQVQFLEIYGENIRDLLDHTRTSKVTIRETATGEVFVSGAREEFVSCASQMLKALEDGTKHRTTASTLMNLSSSRSHAIFTVFLEHTIHTSTASSNPVGESEEETTDMTQTYKTDEDSDAAQEKGEQKITHSKEVRRCKFHFVDLAGSERAKRTGAQGQQMKEGIDINKGLLALGNVISALGDESRKGKIHVPYRVSKLTRMLQDSLGGNSKTLMICCVSPSGLNFYESLNALRYANRARNIQNKPVVNRDPTLVMIDDLRRVVQTLATELVDVRKRSLTAAPEGTLTLMELEGLLSGNVAPKRGMSQLQDGETSPKTKAVRRNTAFDLVSAQSVMSTTRSFSISSPSGNNSSNQLNMSNGSGSSSVAKKKETSKEICKLKGRADESDFELKRMTEHLKRVKQEASEMSDRIILIQSERDFYHIKYSDLKPDDALSFYKNSGSTAAEKSASGAEKNKATSMIAGYLRQIETLKKDAAEMQQQMKSDMSSTYHSFDAGAAELENELSSNVARVIAQTEKHLLQEAKRLKSIGVAVTLSSEGPSARAVAALDDGNETDDDVINGGSGDSSPLAGMGEKKNPFAESQIEEDDLAYHRRQKMLSAEVSELGESIDLKEQLLSQLKNSHHQYGVMKSFYEQKLSALGLEMGEKESERERLLQELHNLETNTNKNEVDAVKQQQEQEKKLRAQLQKRDEELRTMKKRQEELTNLSRVQSRYNSQVTKLEGDIEGMKRQKVDLSKSLQVEKKRHYTLLNEKAREIERLKRDLLASAGEAKRLGKDKLRAEERTRDALKDSAALRKKVHETQKYGIVSESVTSKARLARRAMGGAGKSSAAGILTEEELRVKKWLDRRIADINSREEAADTLRKQCEQQLALLNRKEALELEKSSIEKSMRDVITGTHGGEKSLSREEQEALKEIEDRLESVDSQLKLRDRNISEIESKLASGDIASAQESALEALKKNSAVSLPASHELIRLLFNMLVATKSSSQQMKSSLCRSEAREKQLRQDLDEASRQLNTLRRTHDMEITRTANDYEEKLSGLFTHSTIGKLVMAESDARSLSSDSVDGIVSPEMSPSAGKYKTSAEASYKMLLSVANEQSSLLRSRLERESSRTRVLEGRITEVDITCAGLQRDLEEKDVHIKFLEDERTLFRDLADSLRAGISTLGGETGHTILKQIKDRVGGAVASDESDDETESMLGEYSNLGDIISRTGNVTEKKRNYSPDRSLSSLSISTPNLSSGRDIVYDRLTNPSNFTGSMKNAFGDELTEKREKIKMIKSTSGIIKKDMSGALSAKANHNKEHIALYLEGTTTFPGSRCATPECPLEVQTALPPPPPKIHTPTAKDASVGFARFKAPATGGARTITPPHSRLNGVQPHAGPRIKSLALVKTGLDSITEQLAEAMEGRRRSTSMSGADCETPRSSDAEATSTSSTARTLTDLEVDGESTIPDTDAPSPIQLHPSLVTSRKKRSQLHVDDPLEAGRKRRDSLESTYSSVIDDDKTPEEDKHVEKLTITIPTRHPPSDVTASEKYEVTETKRIKAQDAARAAAEECDFDDEDGEFGHGNGAPGSLSKTREEVHISKIKNRLQSATAPMTPITPRSPLPTKPLAVILKR